METRIRVGLSPSEGRRFGAVVGLAFSTLGVIFVWRGHQLPAGVSMVLGISLVLSGLFVPTRLGPVQAAWMKLASLISKVTTPVLMGIVYFLVITPIGLVMRGAGRNPLKVKGGTEGYWVDRTDSKSSLERQF